MLLQLLLLLLSLAVFTTPTTTSTTHYYYYYYFEIHEIYNCNMQKKKTGEDAHQPAYSCSLISLHHTLIL